MDAEASRSSRSPGSVTSLIVSCAVLALALAPAGLLAAWIVAGRLDSHSLVAASVAVGVCWLAGALALTASFFGNRLGFPVQGLLISMFARMGLPLGIGVALNRAGGPLAEIGILSMILGVYLVCLVVETILSLRLVPPLAKTASTAS